MVKMQHGLTSKTNILTLFAADYDCNAYGAGAYDNNTCATQTDGGVTGGGLADTGYDVIIPVALGVSLIVAGALLLIKRLARRQKARSK